MEQPKTRSRHPLSIQHIPAMAAIANGYERAYTTDRQDGRFRVKLFGVYNMTTEMFKAFRKYADEHNAQFDFNKNSVTLFFWK